MTLPNVSGFVSASTTFAINGTYLGATLPLQIAASSITNTNGVPGATGAVSAGSIGSSTIANNNAVTATYNGAWASISSVNVPANGTYLVSVDISGYLFNGTAGANAGADTRLRETVAPTVLVNMSQVSFCTSNTLGFSMPISSSVSYTGYFTSGQVIAAELLCDSNSGVPTSSTAGTRASGQLKLIRIA